MKIKILILIGLLTTLVCLFLAFVSLASMPMIGGSFLGEEEQTNQMLIQQIHERTSVILLQPEWFKNKTDPAWAWMNTEIIARLGLVFLIWVTIIAFITRLILDNNNPNHRLHPVA